MIQFNLLPDVKLEYIKATYRRRIISLVCFLVAGVFLTIFILMFLFVRVNQTRHLSSLDKQISTNVTELQSKPDLDKILTIQNQLNSLPGLHDQKVLSSRVFEYLGQITPTNVSVSSVELDLEAKTLVLKGASDSIPTVNKFVDTLKFTDYKVEGDEPKGGKAFSSVVLKNFNFDGKATAQDPKTAVSYEISFSFDEAIFANTAKEGSAVHNAVKLTVPSIVTTQSETQKPTNLFQPEPQQEGGN